MEIKKDISLADFSTLQVGGPADFFARVSDLADLKRSFEFAEGQKIPIFIFGGGSNILFSDLGFRGLVIKNEIRGIELDNNFVKVGSGESLVNLIAQSAQKNLAGLENLAGVPGSVGGAVVGNSNSIGEKISRVWVFEKGEIKIIEQKDLQFDYRDSNLRNKILVEVEFELVKSSENLADKIKKNIAEKVVNQPFEKTAGSWFKNPENEKAWELIEKAGCRDLRTGGATVSEKHANFFQNTGDAKSADFIELEKIVIEKVREKFGIELEREVIFLPAEQ